MSLVECRADEIVHRRVDDHENLALALLDVDHRSHEHAGIAHDQAPRLENDPAVQPARAARDKLGVLLRQRRLFDVRR